ncbi:hypothetical protein LSAT2_020852 [Lamellibrachia satsuma]|nr:hypothetical protein LSAT2_020852 [Lamellibrachia satsuma]
MPHRTPRDYRHYQVKNITIPDIVGLKSGCEMARRNRSYSDFEALRTLGGKDCGLLASIAEIIGRPSSRKKPPESMDGYVSAQATSRRRIKR